MILFHVLGQAHTERTWIERKTSDSNRNPLQFPFLVFLFFLLSFSSFSFLSLPSEIFYKLKSPIFSSSTSSSFYLLPSLRNTNWIATLIIPTSHLKPSILITWHKATTCYDYLTVPICTVERETIKTTLRKNSYIFFPVTILSQYRFGFEAWNVHSCRFQHYQNSHPVWVSLSLSLSGSQRLSLSLFLALKG